MMNKSPLVSVVIPTYNRATELERALKSVLSQTYTKWEVLIVDNYSTDSTDKLVKSFCDSRIKLFKIHNDGVIAASRNLGVKYSSGSYVAFLDSDDWWMPNKLEESLKYLEQGMDIVYHDLFLIKKINQRYFWRKTRTRELKKPVFEDLVVNGNTLNNSSVVLRKRVLDEIGEFSENRTLIATEDYIAWLKAAKYTERFKKIPQTLGYYWIGGNNTSNPERTLRLLNTFEEQYRNVILDLNLQDRIYWLNYARGKSYYRLGLYRKAQICLFHVLFMQSTLDIKIKSINMILIGSFKSFFFRSKANRNE